MVFDRVSGQGNTLRDKLVADLILSAVTVLSIEQAAGDACIGDLASVFILELVEAALPAAIAKRFPFGLIERVE